jgi:hypothetical protein
VTTATGDGKIGFVSVEDIARAVTGFLISPRSKELGTERIVVGPELLSFDDVCIVMYLILSLVAHASIPLGHNDIHFCSRKRGHP